MSEGAMKLTPIDMLQLYPEPIIEALVDDDAFRETLGLGGGLQLVLGRAGHFDLPAFYDHVRAIHAGAGPRDVVNAEGAAWTLEAVDVHGQAALRLSRGEWVEHIDPHLVLHPDASIRRAEFERNLDGAGLWPDGLPDWRANLQARPLRDFEVRRLQEAFGQTPAAFAARVVSSFARGTGTAATIAPAERAHYDNLVGVGVASSLAELARDIVHPHIGHLLSIRDGSGGRLALLLGAHSSLLSGSAIERLEDGELTRLLQWARDEGDVLSRVAAIEVGLSAPSLTADRERVLAELVRSVLDEDAEHPKGRLALLSAAIAFIGAEVGRTKVLDDLQPFQRRLAIIAQASLFERTVHGRVDVDLVATWMRARGQRRFFLQTMVEQRLEPRWTAGYLAPEQLKAEFVSRMSLAAGMNKERVPPGALHDLLFGRQDGSLARCLLFPQSFLPGPLEGRVEDASGVPLSAEFERILDKALAPQELTPQSVIALINLRSVFVLDAARVDRAVELIRTAGHRFDASVDRETRSLIFSGLAALAADTRNVDLVAELRMMVRKDRVDFPGEPLRAEFLVALTAVAAHADYEDWGRYLGEWCTELAFQAEGGDAADLQEDLSLLCSIDPALRHRLGSAKAALASVTAND